MDGASSKGWIIIEGWGRERNFRDRCTCTLSADPQLLCIFSWLLLALLVATPRNWLNASVVRFTRTFSEPIRRKPRSFSACSTNHRVTTLQSSSLARPLRTFLPFLSLSFSLFLANLSKGYFFFFQKLMKVIKCT